MATKTNTFDGGPIGVTITTANSGDGSGDAFDSVQHSTGSVAQYSDFAYSGQSGQFNTAPNGSRDNEVIWNSLSSPSEIWGKIVFYLVDYPSTRFKCFFTSGNNNHNNSGIQIGSDGKINYLCYPWYPAESGPPITSITWDGVDRLVVTTSQPVPFALGQQVVFAGFTSSGATVNGTKTVTSVDSSTQYKVGQTSDPGTITVIGTGRVGPWLSEFLGSSSVLPTGQWLKIEFHLFYSEHGGQIEIRYYDDPASSVPVEVIQKRDQFMAKPPLAYYFGFNSDSSQTFLNDPLTYFYYYVDEISVGTDGWATPIDIKNNFEGGTNGASISVLNTGGAGSQRFDDVLIDGSSTAIFDTTHVRDALAAKISVAAGKNVYLEWNKEVTGSYTDIYGKVYIYLTAFPSEKLKVVGFIEDEPDYISRISTTGKVFQGLDIILGSSTITSVQINTAGKIELLDAAGVIQATATNAIALNQFVRIDFHGHFNKTTGILEAELFNATLGPTETISVTNINTGSKANRYRFGSLAAPVGSLADFWLDSISVNSIGWPGARTLLSSSVDMLIKQETFLTHDLDMKIKRSMQVNWLTNVLCRKQRTKTSQIEMAIILPGLITHNLESVIKQSLPLTSDMNIIVGSPEAQRQWAVDVLVGRTLILPRNGLLVLDGTPLSEHNRKPLKIGRQPIFAEQRTITGALKRVLIAQKQVFTVEWEMLPSFNNETVDGKAGRLDLQALSETVGKMDLQILGNYGESNTTISVTVAGYTEELIKRFQSFYWNISLTLNEV